MYQNTYIYIYNMIYIIYDNVIYRCSHENNDIYITYMHDYICILRPSCFCEI